MTGLLGGGGSEGGGEGGGGGREEEATKRRDTQQKQLLLKRHQQNEKQRRLSDTVIKSNPEQDQAQAADMYFPPDPDSGRTESENKDPRCQYVLLVSGGGWCGWCGWWRMCIHVQRMVPCWVLFFVVSHSCCSCSFFVFWSGFPALRNTSLRSLRALRVYFVCLLLSSSFLPFFFLFSSPSSNRSKCCTNTPTRT